MGFLDKVRQQAGDAARKHGGSITSGIDKAGDAVNKATKNKYADKVVKAKSAAKDGVDKARRDRPGGTL